MLLGAALLLGSTFAPATSQEADRTSRELRIAAQRERLVERLAAANAVTWAERYEAELARLHGEWNESGGEEKYIAVRDGWIPAFSTRLTQLLNPEFDVAEEERPPEYIDSVIATIADFDRQLAAHGLELFVVPVPTRLHVYPELVCSEADSWGRGWGPGLTRFEIALLDAGVEVIDLLDAFSTARADSDAQAPAGEQVFLRANTHWAPRGVLAAADAFGERLRSTDWYDPPLARVTKIARYESTDTGIRQPLIEDTPRFPFERVVTDKNTTVESKNSQSPLVLLGDSFVTNYVGNGADLGRQLHHRLGFAPDSISIMGGAAAMVRRVFSRRSDPAEGKHAVVWMFTAGSLLKPEKQWRSIDVFDE